MLFLQTQYFNIPSPIIETFFINFAHFCALYEPVHVSQEITFSSVLD